MSDPIPSPTTRSQPLKKRSLGKSDESHNICCTQVDALMICIGKNKVIAAFHVLQIVKY